MKALDIISLSSLSLEHSTMKRERQWEEEAAAMHTRTDSDETSLGASLRLRPLYYVTSPPHPDAGKISLVGTSPGGSPVHRHHHSYEHLYASSATDHIREFPSSRFSASFNHGSWSKIPLDGLHPSDADADADDDDDDDAGIPVRCYVSLFLLAFIFLFAVFYLVLWRVSKVYKPDISIKSVVFESYKLQAGTDLTGVPTEMVSINSTVGIAFRNPAAFFGLHVSSTQLELYYYSLKIASGNMDEFYLSRKGSRMATVEVVGRQVPLYGGGLSLSSRSAVVPVELDFAIRARTHILSKLVQSKFDRHIHCSLVLREDQLGRRLDLKNACRYQE